MDSTKYKSQSKLQEESLKVLAVVIATLFTLCFISAEASIWRMIAGVFFIASISWLMERKSNIERLHMKNKTVLITGCDTGFGHELAVSLSIQGATVYAGCLDKDSDNAQNLLAEGAAHRLNLLQMDVTKMDQIENAYSRIKEEVGERGLWGVVNNAGLNFLADIELTTMQQFEQVNDINYLGLVRVTKAFIPLVRQAKGRFVNVTSVKGLFCEPFNAAYGATKYAGEAFSDILRLEMKKFDVTVSIIEPCNFGGATDCINMDRVTKNFDTIWNSVHPHTQSLYGSDYFAAHIKNLQDAIPTASLETHLVISAMEDALFNNNPKIRYLIPGGSGKIDWYRWKTYVKPFLPEWLMDRWILRDIQHFPSVHL